MQIEVDIPFDQLVKSVRSLTASQLSRLKTAIEKEAELDKTDTLLESLLLNGPVAGKKELDTIQSNQKAIRRWRNK